MTWALAAMLVVILLFIAASFRILREYQRAYTVAVNSSEPLEWETASLT